MFTRYLPDTAILLRRPYFCFFALHEMEGESFRGKQMLVASFGSGGMEWDSMFEMASKHLSEQNITRTDLAGRECYCVLKTILRTWTGWG